MAKYLLFLVFLSRAAFSQDTVLVKVDEYVRNLMEKTHSPGLAMTVIKDNEIAYIKGFGKLDINSDDEVDENSLFAIGSISKSFTAASLAMLVEQGKLNWDDKVINYLPEFQLYDPWVTREFTIRDLLSHKSGYALTSWGTLFYGSDLSRNNILKRMRFLKPVTSFRGTVAYQNMTYVVAGLVLEKITQTSWESFVREKLFLPLNMKRSFAEFNRIKSQENIASPHIYKNKEIRKIDYRNYDNLGPAGSIYSTARELANYMTFTMNQGIFNNDTLITPAVANEMYVPRTYFPFLGFSEFEYYGFGWFISNQNGYKIIEHGGGVDGFVANIMMVPKLKLGITVLCNQESWVPMAISRYIIGQYIGLKDYDMTTKILEWQRKQIEYKENWLSDLDKNRVKGTSPTLPLDDFCGTYLDEMYGEIYIKVENQKLRISFQHTPAFTATLEHYHYNTFRAHWEDPMILDGLLTFKTSAKNQVTGIELDQPNPLDVNFFELEIKKKN
jgi:CubicO group peptidase (beta-lactamase class C family)